MTTRRGGAPSSARRCTRWPRSRTAAAHRQPPSRGQSVFYRSRPMPPREYHGWVLARARVNPPGSTIEGDMSPFRRKPTLDELRTRREAITRVAAAHGADNVRVFGSVARGESAPDSDVDLLVDVVADAHGFAYFGILEDLRRALTDVLGWDVDVVDSAALRSMKDQVLREVVPL